MTQSLRVRVRREGWWRTLQTIARALVPADFEIWQLSLCTEKPGLLDQKEDKEPRVGEADQLTELRRGQAGLPFEFYRDQVDAIGSCVVAHIDGCLAGIAWNYDEASAGHFLRMGAGDAEIRSVYCLPQFRRRSVARTLIRESCLRLHAQGYQRVYAVIHRKNLASQSAFGAVGFQKISTLKRPAVFGPKYWTREERSESWIEALLQLLLRARVDGAKQRIERIRN